MKKRKYKLNSFQEAWLKALESGKYKQATGSLAIKKEGKLTFSYCCLGVACEVFNEKMPKTQQLDVNKEREYQDESFKDSEIEVSYDGATADLPEKVLNKLKLNGEMGELHTPIANKGRKRVNTDEQEVGSLADMNDSGYSHKQIARFIRAHPEQVFEDAVQNDLT